MKRVIVFLFLLISVLQVAAQNDKNLVFDANAVVRTVKDFTAVEVSGAIDLYLSQGKEEAVAVSASNPDAVARIKTEVKMENCIFISMGEDGTGRHGVIITR